MWQALTSAGLLGDGAAEPAQVLYLWPCNVTAWACWQGVQTQWRVGHAGATGLDYAGVRAFLDEAGLDGDERRSAFAGVRACEVATLAVWAEERERSEQQQAQHGL